MEPGAVIERLWPGGEAVFEPLGGGITNHNFKVVVDGEAFVLRIGGKDTELLGIDRHDEHEASLVAARAGVAPEVVRFLEPEGYLVTRFLGARPIPPEELRRPENLERAARLLRTFHDAGRSPRASTASGSSRPTATRPRGTESSRRRPMPRRRSSPARSRRPGPAQPPARATTTS